MKTIKIKFLSIYAAQVGILLYSLELKTLVTWCESGFMDDTTIYCVVRMNSDTQAITPDLQMEKLREKSFIKILN